MNSFQELEALGTGILEIDVKNIECRFNGATIDSISIAHELNAWLSEDLDQHGIDLPSLEEATLIVSINLTRTSRYHDPEGSIYIGKDRKPIKRGDFFSLEAECRSLIRTDEAKYESARTHQEQWPAGWPET
ncbi:MAG: hypothetical protein R3F50_02615 [Gammaproteobacteria bacterium]